MNGKCCKKIVCCLSVLNVCNLSSPNEESFRLGLDTMLPQVGLNTVSQHQMGALLLLGFIVIIKVTYFYIIFTFGWFLHVL